MKSQANRTLFDAVFRSDINAVQFILDSGFSVNSLDQELRTPLVHAVIDQQLELACFLIGKGAEVNVKDFQGMTPLHFAAQNYDIEMCKLLVDQGALIDAVDDIGNTALWRAEFESAGAIELQEFLIKNGANEQLQNNHGISPQNLREG